jgi:gliding motility-associated protein GldM
MAAVDTTLQPEIYINGSHINTKNGHYSFTAGGIGQHQFSGYILMKNGAGDMLRRDFAQKFEVITPPSGATIAADLMNVLYAGYSNPMSVSVPGIPQNAVRVSMSGGSLSAKGNGHYVAVPSAVGKDVVFSISATDRGKTRSMGTFAFKVRKLPDPTPYMVVGTDRFKGGNMSKAALVGATGVSAAIDDGLLDIPFKVLSFETVFFDNMGNAVPMASNGSQYSERQRDTFRKLSRSKRFYITKVTAVGPDGITRKLPSAMEVVVR